MVILYLRGCGMTIPFSGHIRKRLSSGSSPEFVMFEDDLSSVEIH
jgi:hypothetical protein